MSFGGQRTTTPKFAAKANAKRINFGDDEHVDDEPKAEAVTGFEDNKIKHLHEPENPKEMVIPSLPNADFRREAASRRALYLPETGLHGRQNAGPTQPEVLGQQVRQFGLQVSKKTKVEEGSEMQVDETVAAADRETEAIPSQSLEQSALAALIREAESNGEEPASALVIPNEMDVFRHDVRQRPDETTLEEYEEVPVEQFGAALLRGMGWKEGQSLGGGKSGRSEPLGAKNFVRREALLGLGAKPEDIPASERPNRRSAYEFSETNLFIRKDKDSRRSSRSDTPADDKRSRDRSRSPRRYRSPPGKSRREDRSPKRSKRDTSLSEERSRRDTSRSGDRSRRRDERRR